MDESLERVPVDDKRMQTIVKVYKLFEEEGFSPQATFPILLSMVSQFIAVSLVDEKREQDLEDTLADIKRSLKKTTTAYMKIYEEEDVR